MVLTSLVVLGAAIAVVVVMWTDLLFGPLEAAVAVSLASSPEIPSPGWLVLVDHPPEIAGVIDALAFAIWLVLAGLVVGGVPFVIGAWVVQAGAGRQAARWSGSVTALQAVFTFQLCSFVVTALIAVGFVVASWPIWAMDVEMAVGVAVFTGMAAVNFRAARFWIRLRGRA